MSRRSMVIRGVHCGEDQLQQEHRAPYPGDSADTITLDDNWADTTIDGGAGNDIFHVNMFKSERDAANANIASDDEFETVLKKKNYNSTA